MASLNPIKTGRTYDIQGDPKVIRPIWNEMKEVCPGLLLVSADSDNVATIGTDSKEHFDLVTKRMKAG